MGELRSTKASLRKKVSGEETSGHGEKKTNREKAHYEEKTMVGASLNNPTTKDQKLDSPKKRLEEPKKKEKGVRKTLLRDPRRVKAKKEINSRTIRWRNFPI